MDVESLENYLTNNILSSRLVTQAIIDEFRLEKEKQTELPTNVIIKINSELRNIEKEIKEWERLVWFNGLQKKVQDSSNRGFKMSFGNDSDVLVFSCAGRTLFTIRSKEAEITIIAAEDAEYSSMGQQHILATQQQAIDLLKASYTAYKNGAVFEEDNNVSIF